MTLEESIVGSLVNEFAFLEGKCSIARQRRIFAEIPQDSFIKVIEYVSKNLSFAMLCTITGLDMGEEIQMVYHLANENGIMVNLKYNVPKANPVIDTITGIYQGASLYERELTDMFGVKVAGLPAGQRYPLPDWWPEGQYPLRKDWKPDMLNQCGGES